MRNIVSKKSLGIEPAAPFGGGVGVVQSGSKWLFWLQGTETYASFLRSWGLGVIMRTQDLAWESCQELGQV